MQTTEVTERLRWVVTASAAISALLVVNRTAQGDADHPARVEQSASFVVRFQSCVPFPHIRGLLCTFQGVLTNHSDKPLQICRTENAVSTISMHKDGKLITPLTQNDDAGDGKPNLVMVKPGHRVRIQIRHFSPPGPMLADSWYYLAQPGKYEVVFQYECGEDLRVRAAPVPFEIAAP